MKKILITGKNSYIGTSFEKWVADASDKYQVDSLSVRGESWKEYDFSQYDTVLHVAGIAHSSSNSKLEDKYYEVNRDLAIETAKKAKKDGVKQFIFMSSIIVYGSKNEYIDKNTMPNPDNFYGDSKLQAEKGLKELESDQFKLAIIRPPMIYGKDSKGNYPLLSKFAQISPVFPDYKNKRSMLHIDNLTEFLKRIIDNEENGMFFPQNKEYVCTSELVKTISEVHDKKIKITKLFNSIIKLFLKINIVNKVFGNLYYDQSLSMYYFEYQIINFKETIIKTES